MKDYTLGQGVQFNLIKCTINSEQQEVVLGSREAKLLELFCENPNQLLDKVLMTNKVWGSIIVSETSLTKAISNLRKALSRFHNLVCEIRTIPKEGYIFIFENKCNSLNVADNILPGKDSAKFKVSNNNQEHYLVDIKENEKIEEKKSKNVCLVSLTIISSLISSVITVTLFSLVNFS
ncbi:winged helix-turn-helix domain-containing protein [Providencia rettgeri]|nr:winged helix-turn-helix domain-containing protein [Providencia rettgeri]